MTSNTPIQIAVLGHGYGSPTDTNYALNKAALNRLIKLSDSLDFIVLTGDLIRHSNQQNFDSLQEQLSRLNSKYHIAPGNHDMGNRPLYKKELGHTNYAEIINNDAYFFFDNTTFGWHLDSIQNSIIEKTRKKLNDNSRIFVFIHNVWWYKDFPFVAINSNAGEHKMNFKSLLTHSFQGLKNDAYIFAGDVGVRKGQRSSSFIKMNNFHLITSGIGGLKDDHLLKVTVGDSVIINKMNIATGILQPLYLDSILNTKNSYNSHP